MSAAGQRPTPTPLLVVGLQRAGTRFVTDCLNRHPEVRPAQAERVRFEPAGPS